MRTYLSEKIRNTPYVNSSKSDIWNLLLEAADTLEHHEEETDKLENRLIAINERYSNLYKNREQLVVTFRIAFFMAVITTAILTSIFHFYIR